MKFKVLKPFEDLKEKRIRKAEEVFEVSAARGKELLANLPDGYLKEIKETSKKEDTK